MRRVLIIALPLAIAGVAMVCPVSAQEPAGTAAQEQPKDADATKPPERDPSKPPPRKATSTKGMPITAEDILKRGDALWEMTSETFMEEFSKHKFRFDMKKNTARATGLGGAEITISGQSVLETVATFKEGKLDEIAFTVYNRKDIGIWPLDRYEKTVAAVTQGINRFTGGGTSAAKAPEDSLALKSQVATWVKKPHRIVQEWASSELIDKTKQAEFIRVVASKYDPAAAQSPQQAAKKIDINTIRATLPSKVTSDDDGNVSIRDIPRVNDAMKRAGPCVVLERLMKHYELPVDDHVFTQLDDLSRDKAGTVELATALKKAAPFLRCKADDVVPLDGKRFERLVPRYNAAAEKAGLALCAWDFRHPNLQRFYASVNPKLFRELQSKDAEIKTLLTKVRVQIDQGLPLVWVVLMTATEQEQARDAYFRIITGYNISKNELLYMEFWGSAYSMRRMPVENAWPITVGIIALTPTSASF